VTASIGRAYGSAAKSANVGFPASRAHASLLWPAGTDAGRTKLMLTRVLAMLALVAAAGATGMFAGRASHDPDAGWSRGYNAGVRAEAAAQGDERARVTARYQPGASGFEAIYAAGRSEGRRLGRYEGLAAGRRAGFRDGRATALPDFPGGWRTHHWYIVRLEPGSDARFRIAQRVTVERGHQYGPCLKDPDRMCMTVYAPPSAR
jgi:hypothetical protein